MKAAKIVPRPLEAWATARLHGDPVPIMRAREEFIRHKDVITSYRTPLQIHHDGSWNIRVVAWCSWLVGTGHQRPAELLLQYCRDQLGQAGLWGQELLSPLYWWPLAGLAAVHRHLTAEHEEVGASFVRPDALREELTRAVAKVLRAHVHLLSLFRIWLDPERAGPWTADSRKVEVWHPGMRTASGSWYNYNCDGTSYHLWHALMPGRAPRPRRGQMRRWWGWPWRVTAAAEHGYMEPEERTRLLGYPGAILHAAKQLEGIRTRAPINIGHHPSGEMVAYLGANTHGTKAPCVAVSVVARRKHHLIGREGEALGAWLDIEASRVRLKRERTLLGSIPAPASWRWATIKLGPQIDGADIEEAQRPGGKIGGQRQGRDAALRSAARVPGPPIRPASDPP